MYLYEVAKFARDVGHASELYLACGLSVIPLRGKRPAIKWTEYQVERPTLLTLYGWKDALENVGIVCGSVSNNLVVIDLDGSNAVQTFKSTFPSLLQTYQVLTGSGKGLHLYYYVRNVPESTRLMIKGVGNIEVRANGCQIVAPPSVHPDTGKKYTGHTLLPVMNLDNLDNVVTWIKTIHTRTQPAVKTYSAEPIRNGSAYGQRALDGECRKVSSTMAGNRNAQLNKSAFRLGQLVNAGHLTSSEVESALYRAAASLTQEDGETATIRTIKSGLLAGMNNPRR